MTKVIIVQRIFAIYRKGNFDRLRKIYDLIIIHSHNFSGIKQTNTEYSIKVGSIRVGKKETMMFLNVFPVLIKHKPHVLIHEFSIGIFSLIPTMIFAKLFNIKFILWGHGYDRNKGFYPDRSILDKLRIYLMKKANAVILYGAQAKKELSNYIDEKKLFVANNSLDTRKLSNIRDRLEKEGRSKVKERIGFSKKYNLIFIGRLTTKKWPQILVDIFDLLKEEFRNVLTIHIIGDGEEYENLQKEIVERNFQENFILHGAIHNEVKNGEMLFCSDLMVIPGKIGLSLNHSFNFDCPVITFAKGNDGPFHAPEIEYLINNKTGFIVKEKTPLAMANIIRMYLTNYDLQKKIRNNIRYMVDNVCSIDKFVEGFNDAINYVNKND